MTAVDEYLRRVSRGLAGMDRRVREDVLRELRSHLTDAAREMDEVRALAAAESPEVVAARYKEMYGYGRPFQILFVAAAAILAVFTLPLLYFFGAGTTESFAVAIALLVALVGYLLWVAVIAGSRVGLLAGIAAAVARLVAVLALGAIADAVVATIGGWALFAISSGLLVFVGWIPGRARERWRPRDVSL